MRALAPCLPVVVLAGALAGALAGGLAGAARAQGDAKEERIVLPSGLEARLQERIDEAGGPYRFRYVAPDFDTGAGLDIIAADLDHLCDTHALVALAAGARDGARVVISLADAPSEFGVYDPDVTQVFEAYRVEGGRCIWEEF